MKSPLSILVIASITAGCANQETIDSKQTTIVEGLSPKDTLILAKYVEDATVADTAFGADDAVTHGFTVAVLRVPPDNHEIRVIGGGNQGAVCNMKRNRYYLLIADDAGYTNWNVEHIGDTEVWSPTDISAEIYSAVACFEVNEEQMAKIRP